MTVRKIVDGKMRAHTTVEREPVWLATKCGKVVKSHWLWPEKIGAFSDRMTKARWVMFGENAQPLAWRPFVEGEFPSHVDPITKKRVYPNGEGPEFPAMIVGVAA